MVGFNPHKGGVRIGCLWALLCVTFGLIGAVCLGDCYNPQSMKTALSYAELKQSILSNRIESAQDLLEFFSKSEKFQGLLEEPLLLRTSTALNGDSVTAEFPRILMHSGNLAVHLTANPTKTSADALEIIEFLPGEARFAFRFIDFGFAGSRKEFVDHPETLSDTDSKPYQLHGEFFNCATCHTGPSHSQLLPNWNLLTDLHKAYGTSEGKIRHFSQEREQFRSFQKTLASSERGNLYRWLKINLKTEPNDDIIFPGKPNELFTKRLYEESRYQTARRILESREYKAFPNAVIAAFFNCDGIEGFLPPSHKAQHEERLIRYTKKGIGSLWVGVLQESQVKDSDWKRIETWQQEDFKNGSFHNLELGEWLAITKLSLTEAIAFFIEGDIVSTVQAMALEASANLVSTQFKKKQENAAREFLNREYVSRLSKLMYVVQPSVGAWSIPETRGRLADLSYRIAEGSQGLDQVLSCHIGDAFLKEHPEFNFFPSGKMAPSELTIPRERFCSLLRIREH